MKNSSQRPMMLAVILAALGLTAPASAQKLITLDKAYRLAMDHHPSIKVLRERVNQARTARYRSWSAVKPSAIFQGNFTHHDKEISFQNFFDPTGDDIVMQKQNQFGFNLVAKVPLFVGPAYPGISMAKKMVKVAELTEEDYRRSFQLQVANAYYMVVSQKEVVRSLEAKVAVDRKHLAAARARVEAGQSARVEVLRADLVATQDGQTLRVARNNLQAARRQLAILLGLRGSVDVKRPPEPARPGKPFATMLGAALRNRHDYKASALSVDMARSGKLATWLSFAPTLDVSWIYRWSEATDFTGDSDAWYLMFNLNLPLYDGGTRYANLRESASKIREARHQRAALRSSIEGQLVRLRKEVASAEAGVISARKAVKLASVTEGDMEASFAAGAVTQLDVLDATQRHLEANIGLISTLYKRDMTRLALANALGQYNPTRSKR